MDNLRDLGLLKCQRCLKARPQLPALMEKYSTIGSLLSVGLALVPTAEAVAPTVAVGVVEVVEVVGLVEEKAGKDTK